MPAAKRFFLTSILRREADPIEATADDRHVPIGVGVGWCLVPDSTDSELSAGSAAIRGNGFPRAGRIGLGGNLVAEVE